MRVIPHLPLAARTTLRVGGPAAWWIEVETLQELSYAYHFARQRRLPFVVVGEGSNVLALDEGFGGVVARLRMDAITLDESNQLIVAEGGAHWDDVVDVATRAGWWGLERLAGIPGSAGAAVVQNIGAYGREMADVLAWAQVYHPQSGKLRRVVPDELSFSYRTSALKEGSLAGWVVVRAAWRLSRTPLAPSRPYPQVEAELTSAASPAEAAAIIRTVRARKLPDVQVWGTAGSFFLNPTVNAAQARRLFERYPELPYTPLEGGSVRIALAWLLDRVLSLRGVRVGSARLYEHQPLVVAVDPHTARAADVRALARFVVHRVREEIGITLVPEVETLLPNGFMRCVWC